MINPLVRETPTFWFVWTKKGRVPRYSHHTEESAQREADRLALKHPGNKYIVLEAKTKVHVPTGDGGTVMVTKEAE